MKKLPPRPGNEPEPPAWQSDALPLDHGFQKICGAGAQISTVQKIFTLDKYDYI